MVRQLASLRAMEPTASPLPQLSDDELVRLAQAGGNDEFAELTQRYRPACLKMARSILRNTADAEDEVQNALWKAFQHIRQFQHDARFSTWLMRIVVNQCLMRLRGARRSRLCSIDAEEPGSHQAAARTLPASTATPEEELGREQVRRTVAAEIRRIPPLLRNVVLLRDVRRLPMPDVAEQLGISVAAAKSRLLRARTELKKRMEKHGGRGGPATLMA